MYIYIYMLFVLLITQRLFADFAWQPLKWKRVPHRFRWWFAPVKQQAIIGINDDLSLNWALQQCAVRPLELKKFQWSMYEEWWIFWPGHNGLLISESGAESIIVIWSWSWSQQPRMVGKNPQFSKQFNITHLSSPLSKPLCQYNHWTVMIWNALTSFDGFGNNYIWCFAINMICLKNNLMMTLVGIISDWVINRSCIY